ncbi:MAG: endonuclease domain-containing protein [Myxococcota bacterium]
MRARSTRYGNSAQQLELRARQHRAQLTASESHLWLAINAGQLGVRFRRQVPLGAQFIADFVAPAARLVVEVDGEHHAPRKRADASRDRKLARLGYRVVRIDAELVLRDVGAAVALIRAVLICAAW